MHTDPLPEPTPGTLEFRVLKAVAEEVSTDGRRERVGGSKEGGGEAERREEV